MYLIFFSRIKIYSTKFEHFLAKVDKPKLTFSNTIEMCFISANKSKDYLLCFLSELKKCCFYTLAVIILTYTKSGIIQ